MRILYFELIFTDNFCIVILYISYIDIFNAAFVTFLGENSLSFVVWVIFFPDKQRMRMIKSDQSTSSLAARHASCSLVSYEDVHSENEYHVQSSGQAQSCR